MNFDQANQIPIHHIAEYLGATYSRKGRVGELWYFSPFREEKTASFKIDERRNRWHDFGHVSPAGKSGGDVIDLWCEYHRLDRRADGKAVLQALKDFSNVPDMQTLRQEKKKQFRQLTQDTATPEEPRFKIAKLHKKIFFPSLLEELQRRRISPAVANLYIKQVFLTDTENSDRKLNGFAFENHKGGYEISIPNPATGKSFKTSTQPKTYTLIKGANPKQACIFEGFWDFLSYLELNKTLKPKYDCYVLNSVSFWHETAQDIIGREEKVSLVSLFMDNDIAGDQATDNFCNELDGYGIIVDCQRHNYEGFKDLNDYFCTI